MKYSKTFALEQDLICVSQEEFNNRIAYFVDKEEIINMIKNTPTNSFYVQKAKNHYLLYYNDNEKYSIYHFICPLYADNHVKQWWKDIQNYLQKMEV